jgi:hypothetical protein
MTTELLLKNKNELSSIENPPCLECINTLVLDMKQNYGRKHDVRQVVANFMVSNGIENFNQVTELILKSNHPDKQHYALDVYRVVGIAKAHTPQWVQDIANSGNKLLLLNNSTAHESFDACLKRAKKTTMK